MHIQLRSVLLCCWLAQALGWAATSPDPNSAAAPTGYSPDRILVKPKAGTRFDALTAFHSTHRGRVLQTFQGIGGLQVVSLPEGETVPGFIAKYQQSGLMEFAEPDYVRHTALTPNDPKYLDGTLWGLYNYGQSNGTAHADIDAPEAWDVLTSASNIVVAILDTGVRYTHEDLAANMWTNPSDGSHGFNAIAGTNDPNDDNGHGTEMAGILGAVGNNGTGVVGVAWSVQMMACKCFNNFSSGNDSAIIACVDYARTNGARIINASFDSPTFGLGLSNAIVAASAAGIIVVASAGNSASPVNIDVTPHYPACFLIDNIVSVAYTTRTDALGALSNYGATNVDLVAPGDQLYSTFSATDSYYWPPYGLNLAGTSYAAAYVSGAFALVLAKYPAETYQQAIARVLSNTDPVAALDGKCVTGGRLNLRKALKLIIRLTTLQAPPAGLAQFRVSCDANRTCVIEAATDLPHWAPIYTNTTSAAGTFDYTDSASTSLSQRFYRVVAAP